MKFPPKIRSDWGWLTLIILPTSWLYFSNIARWSIWHDESYTAMLINYDWSEILRRTALDVHPPLFYFILKAWSTVFGSSLLAIRSFSALCMLALIVLAYWFIKSLLGNGAARLSTVFLALAPFLLRYAQEARMYAWVSLLLLSATYLLLTAIRSRNQKLLYLYSLVMALAIYSHYYAIFLVPAHWLYVLLVSRRNRPKGVIDLKNKHWWGANIAIVALLAPWLPTAFNQFTSIQGAFWIPSVSGTTLLGTIANWLFYREYWMLDLWQKLWLYAFTAGLATITALAIYFNKLQRRTVALFSIYAFLPPLIILLLSLPPFQPIYNNRYFSLTAVAFYLLLAILVYLRPLNRWRATQAAVVAVVLVSFVYGIVNVRAIGNYNPDRREHYTMGQLAEEINKNYQDGDSIVSTNLSTYFDIRYYNRTSATVRLHVGQIPTGEGNTSLVYDRPEILLYDYSRTGSASGVVWLVTDSIDEQPDVPENWELLSRREDGYAAIAKYHINPSTPQSDNDIRVCAQVVTEARDVANGGTRTFPSSCLPEGWVPVTP